MRSWKDAVVTVPCCDALPSLNPAAYRYDVAPLPGLHAIANVTPPASAAT
jgi:hypothetical protein